MIKLQQYHVFKITTSRLNESDCKIDKLTVHQARLNGELVQIGDNQVFRSIRHIRNQKLDSKRLNELTNKRNKLKQDKEINANEIHTLQQEIDSILFVPDIVNVKVDDKRTYKHICKNGMQVNGITYLRLSSGAGQSRRNTASFVNVEIKEELERKLNCGLKIDKINVAKYNAYFGLHMSATYPVRTPRVCLIPDCEEYKLIKTVDWIEDITDDNGKEIRKIRERDDFEFVPNLWDGQGLISPSFAAKWQKDLELDYLPSQFGIRTAFIKGMLCTFDFHKYASEIAKTNKILDYYGKEWDISEIDILLSTSQFKMYKYYSSWDQYTQLHELHKHSWGVTKVNPKNDNEMSLSNYQYIQTLNLSNEKIEKLIEPTVNWIKNICEGEKLHSLLFLLGNSTEGDTLSHIFDRTNSNFVKAVLYNDKLLNDPYIKKKLYDGIATKIQEAKIGRLWCRANYQCMVSDPYGQAQWAFNRKDVTGLLGEFEHYSHFWNERNVSKVDACRSPMVDFHEHNILNFKKNEDTREWYKYIKSGIVYNCWGTDTIRHSDSDWDYDIVFTTDNEIIMNNIYPDKNVITYDKASAPPQKLNAANLVKTDLRSFDSKVGSITNYSTTFISMLANFKEDSEEYQILLDRIKLLRRYIGDSIDQAKGIKMKPFPSDWKKREYLYEDDDEQTKQDKYKHNSLVANRKPYFMIYVYDKLRNEYNEYKKKCERTCKEKFGCSLDQLLKKQDKSSQEMYYVSDYYRRMPVIKNNAVMNVLCSMVEKIDFKYKRPKNTENANEMFEILYDKSIPLDIKKLNQLIELYKKFKKKRHFKHKNNILKYIDFEIDQDNEHDKQVNEFYEGIRHEAELICPNQRELANYLVYIVYYLYPSETKEFAWSIGINGILETLESKSDKLIEIPMSDSNGTDYLGKKYSLQRVVV